MGTQGLDDFPDALELGITFNIVVVILDFFRRNTDRQNDVAVLFVLRLAHHAPNRLDDIDDGFPRIEEHHRIQRGHINPFGQTAGIGEDAAFPRVTLTLEPV